MNISSLGEARQNLYTLNNINDATDDINSKFIFLGDVKNVGFELSNGRFLITLYTNNANGKLIDFDPIENVIRLWNIVDGQFNVTNRLDFPRV